MVAGLDELNDVVHSEPAVSSNTHPVACQETFVGPASDRVRMHVEEFRNLGDVKHCYVCGTPVQGAARRVV